jgi:hypothetical protein
MSRLDEKRFTALGVEWIARLDFNATCAIEEETGESFYAVAAPFLAQLDQDDRADPAKVLAALGNRHNSRIRLILFHALAGQHQLTLDEVGEIIGDIGLQEAMGVVLWAIAKGLGADTGEEGNAKAAPAPAPNRKARRTGAARG